MPIDYWSSQKWDNLCEELVQRLHFSQGLVKVYQGVPHGLMEIGLGLAQFFPHKKKIYYFKTLNPYFIKLVRALALEGHEVQELTLSDMRSPQKWVGSMGANDLFILYPLDDPILGRLYPVETLERHLSQNPRVFKICVSHNKHKYMDVNKETDSHKVTLYSMDFETCCAHLGKKVPTKEFVAGALNWDQWQSKNFNFGSLNEAKESVINLEAALNDSPPLLDTQRIFDRAVLCWEDMDGFALIDQVACDLNLSLSEAGRDPYFEAMSLSRWPSENFMELLETAGFSPSQRRGLVIFSHKLVDSQFVDVVRAARKKVLNRQSGKV